MDIKRGLKRAASLVMPPLLFLSLAGYFGWSATRGDLGLQSLAARQRQLVTETASLDAANAERDRWLKLVGGLRAEHVDPDTLDERARAMLNLADPTDIVVPYPPGHTLY